MTKRPRPNLVVPPPAKETAEAVAAAKELQRGRSRDAGDRVHMVTSTIHLPNSLLAALQRASLRRAERKRLEDPRGRGGRPSVSEIVVELLERQRKEIDSLD